MGEEKVAQKSNMASIIRQVKFSQTAFYCRKTIDAHIPSCCHYTSHRKLSYHNQQFQHSSSQDIQSLRNVKLLSPNGWSHRHSLSWSGIAGVRWNSTASDATKDTASDTLAPGYIPEPPPIPATPDIPAIPVELNALGEPTLSSLGFCNYTPPGLFQKCLETLHVGIDLPWWGAIIVATCAIRILMFPLVVKAQINAANMNNHMPTVQKLQERFTKARMTGNPLEAARCGGELQDYMSRNDINPVRNMYVPLVQGPIFVSVFIGLRKMANLPVESLKTGGLYWISDLTIPDPFYILPLMTVASFLATIELGVDGARAANMSHGMRWGFRLMPVIMFPLIMNFPAAMCLYWFTSNS